MNNLALFSGVADSDVNIESIFQMTTNNDNDVVLPGKALSISLSVGARVFDMYGSEVSAASIESDSDIDAFGLAIPELSTVDEVNTAFVIVNNKIDDKKLSGSIVSINLASSEIVITIVSALFSGDVCVDISDVDIFLLTTDDNGISSSKLSIYDLSIGMPVDVYGVEIAGQSCFSGNVVLATGS